MWHTSPVVALATRARWRCPSAASLPATAICARGGRWRGLATVAPDNPYQLLGVGTACTEAELKTAFRTKALEWHPDRWPVDSDQAAEATARFQLAEAAFRMVEQQRQLARWELPSRQRPSSNTGTAGRAGGRASSTGFQRPSEVAVGEIVILLHPL